MWPNIVEGVRVVKKFEEGLKNDKNIVWKGYMLVFLFKKTH